MYHRIFAETIFDVAVTVASGVNLQTEQRNGLPIGKVLIIRPYAPEETQKAAVSFYS